jgi:hypothetical protein
MMLADRIARRRSSAPRGSGGSECGAPRLMRLGGKHQRVTQQLLAVRSERRRFV